MKSRVWAFSPFRKRISSLFDTLSEDRITVYGAQTAFYMCISAIPFVMLLIIISRFVFADSADMWNALRGILPREGQEVADFIFSQAGKGADIPLISTAALTALWSVSRAMRALMNGISQVYGVTVKGNFIYRVLISLVCTGLFLFTIVATAVFFAFGSALGNLGFFRKLSFSGVVRVLAFGAIPAFYFALLYYAASKGAYLFKTPPKVQGRCPKTFWGQLSGAFLAAAFWMLFSYFYSLYIRFFSRSSYLYGSLGAVVFLMLWLYFCIVIILLGAEINKLLYMRRKG